MAHLSNLNYSPPPPAYSEQELDQKISLASQLSLTSHQSQNQVAHEDEWETWDEAAFEEAALKLQRMSLQSHSSFQEERRIAGSSSQRSSAARLSAEIHPLRIHKKNPSGGSSSGPLEKPKPSWLSEAETDISGASSSRAPLPTLAAPAYTPNAASSESSPVAETPSSTLTNPYQSSEWGAASPVASLPDPHPDQDEEQPESLSDIPPALTDESLPPPPFSSDAGGHFLNPHPDTSGSYTAPATSATLVPGPPSTRGSSPAYSPNPDTNLALPEHISSVVPQEQQRHPQQYISVRPHLQPGGTYQSYSLPRHSLAPPVPTIPPPQPRPPSDFPSIPYRSQGSVPSHNVTALSPQTMPAPRIRVDLSTIYGKRPAVTMVNDSQPPQVFDAAAFYNSAVSAHLGYSKPVPNSLHPARKIHQPPSNTSLYNFPHAAQSMPGKYLSPSPIPARNPYSPRPHNSTLQDPSIRSPTPTYPAGHASNPMPQMLAAADEGHYGYQQSYAPERGPAVWTESSHFYR